MFVRVEFPTDETGNETAKCGADLISTGRKIFPDQSNNPRFHTGNFAWYFDKIYVAELPRLDIVLPGDAEQVKGIDIPKAHACQLLLNGCRHRRGITHLRECRNRDATFSASCRSLLEDTGIAL